MLSGDTPLSTNAAFQARQEMLGSATMILSVGNKM
jgi:U4/U6.U5 tri-snRNP-associated protein 1